MPNGKRYLTSAVLGDDAFQSKRPGVFQDFGAVTQHLLGKLDRTNRTIEQICQQMPADPKFDLSQIVPVEIQKIEGKKDGFRRSPFAAAPAERALQRSEVGPALGIENDGFPIQDGGPDPELFGSCRNRRKPMRPVVTATGDDADALRLDMDGEPIAVPLVL